jgi:hypothetical protein
MMLHPATLMPRSSLNLRHSRLQLQDEYSSDPGSVLEFDIYHADTLLPMTDDDVIQRLLTSYLPAALQPPHGVAGVAPAGVVDASVLRFKNATTVFSPGSGTALPPICSSIANVFTAGDCMQQGPGTHGAKGLSQEKAYVSGLQVRGLGQAADTCACGHAPNRLGNVRGSSMAGKLAVSYDTYMWGCHHPDYGQVVRLGNLASAEHPRTPDNIRYHTLNILPLGR